MIGPDSAVLNGRLRSGKLLKMNLNCPSSYKEVLQVALMWCIDNQSDSMTCSKLWIFWIEVCPCLCIHEYIHACTNVNVAPTETKVDSGV